MDISRYIAKNREKQRKEALQKAIRDYPGIPSNKETTTGQQLFFKDILLSDYLRMRYKDSSWNEINRWNEIKAQRIYYPDNFKCEVVLKEDEYFNNGGNSNYIRINTLSIVVAIASKLIQERHPRYPLGSSHYGKEFNLVEVDEEYKKTFFPRNASRAEDIALLKGKTIKDAVLRFGLNRGKGVFSEIGKVISVQLEDGIFYDLNGDKLPWHRFGDYSIDYGNHDYDGRSEFEGMEEQEDGTFEAKYSYSAYEKCDPYADYHDDWKEMAAEGAQFSWMD